MLVLHTTFLPRTTLFSESRQLGVPQVPGLIFVILELVSALTEIPDTSSTSSSEKSLLPASSL